MRSIKAIFIKQFQDILKNKAVIIQYIIYPVIAFLMTQLVAKGNDEISDTMFVIMFSTIFAGMALITTVASTIAEDKENKSLKFLLMAGVKPHQYILGIGGVIMCISFLVAIVFALIGGFQGSELMTFIFVIMLSAIGSILLGATIGLLSKNQQAAISVGMPIAMILGFGPMIAMFNESAEKIFYVTYTQQVSIIVNDFGANPNKSILIICANILILLSIFAFVYKKKGLKN